MLLPFDYLKRRHTVECCERSRKQRVWTKTRKSCCCTGVRRCWRWREVAKSASRWAHVHKSPWRRAWASQSATWTQERATRDFQNRWDLLVHARPWIDSDEKLKNKKTSFASNTHNISSLRNKPTLFVRSASLLISMPLRRGARTSSLSSWRWFIANGSRL